MLRVEMCVNQVMYTGLVVAYWRRVEMGFGVWGVHMDDIRTRGDEGVWQLCGVYVIPTWRTLGSNKYHWEVCTGLAQLSMQYQLGQAVQR